MAPAPKVGRVHRLPNTQRFSLETALRTPVRPRVAAAAAALALVVGAAGAAAALALTGLGVDRVSVFTGRTDASHFTVTAFTPKVKGLAKVDVAVGLRNGDADGHAADVTVQLLDAAGDVLAEDTVATGVVAGGASWAHAYSFTGAGLAGGYHGALLVVDDTS